MKTKINCALKRVDSCALPSMASRVLALFLIYTFPPFVLFICTCVYIPKLYNVFIFYEQSDFSPFAWRSSIRREALDATAAFVFSATASMPHCSASYVENRLEHNEMYVISLFILRFAWLHNIFVWWHRRRSELLDALFRWRCEVCGCGRLH